MGKRSGLRADLTPLPTRRCRAKSVKISRSAGEETRTPKPVRAADFESAGGVHRSQTQYTRTLKHTWPADGGKGDLRELAALSREVLRASVKIARDARRLLAAAKARP